MNMLNRFLGHDYATTREMLVRCQELTDAQMDQVFDAGWGTLRKTFAHMIGNIEVWTDLMMERMVRSGDRGTSISDLLRRHDAAYAEFADFARKIEREGRLDDLWTDVLDNPPTEKSYGGAIGHVIIHNQNHRTEALHMMQRLGMTDLPEGDLMGWDQDQRTRQE